MHSLIKKCTITQNKHKNLKPGLVAFYEIRPGNRAGLFSKEKTSKKKVNKKDLHIQANNIYQIKSRAQNALVPHGAGNNIHSATTYKNTNMQTICTLLQTDNHAAITRPTTHTHLMAPFRDYPGKPVPER